MTVESEAQFNAGNLIETVHRELAARQDIGVATTAIYLSHSAADAWQLILQEGSGVGAVDSATNTLYGVPVVLVSGGVESDPIKLSSDVRNFE